MGENHILKGNQWFVYDDDVKWLKLQNGKNSTTCRLAMEKFLQCAQLRYGVFEHF